MGREVKVIILHVKILLYHRYDPVYDEGSRGTDEMVCSLGRFRVDDSEGDDQMYEREQLLPSLVSAHEWIAGQDTLF